ncbi:MAG: hypothetical protein QOI58_3541 [Thermoanaerobaculia bacterium]|jgi:hypothetical protein|nr:hypothetical protein [Thermoanaerobaculia bacterium]
MADGPLPLSHVLGEEYERLHGALEPRSEEQSESERLKYIFGKIHKVERSALCISGGGIRSATFALGVMQRLARVGVLPKFDYLSTVSGGGYIGSWLSSYARRNPGGMAGVAKELTEPPSKRDPLRPEPAPLMWLRQFSNYLTPRLGLLSGDTWAVAGIYLRNLLLNWLMFVPLLVAALAVPRLSMALLHQGTSDPLLIAGVAIVTLLIAVVVLAFARPVSYKEGGWLTNGKFLLGVFLPLFISSIFIVLYWGTTREITTQPLPWSWVYYAFIGSSVFSSVCYLVRFIVASAKERRTNVRPGSSLTGYTWKKAIHELAAAGVAGVAGAWLLQLGALYVFPDPLKQWDLPSLASWKQLPPQLTTAPGEFFLCFGVPAVLLILFIQSAIFVGGASWFNEEYDREWWGRAGGWVLVAAFVWIVFTAVAIYGPVLIYSAPKIFAAIGGVSGLAAILLGRSGKTAANEKEKDEKASATESGTSLALGLVGPIFVIAILSVLSLATSRIWLKINHDRIVQERSDKKLPPLITDKQFDFYSTLPRLLTEDRTQYNVGKDKDNKDTDNLEFKYAKIDAAKQRALEHLFAVDQTGVYEGLVLVVGLTLLGYLVSLFIGVNQFSMHGLYRNRLISAYLGASRHQRSPNCFSGFDPNDNLPMHLLRPEMFWANSFKNIGQLSDKIAGSSLEGRLEPKTVRALKDSKDFPDDDDKCLQAGELLASDLNGLLDEEELSAGSSSTLPLSLRNRLFMEDKCKGHITPFDVHKRPMHIVNMALNLVGGDSLAWQERKAESFTVSPLYSGTPTYSEMTGESIGYRPTRLYGGPDGVSLGTAVAISGAAASPNMGYNSSPAVSFLLTLFNVRLGWWYGNPGKAGNGTFQQRNPTSSLHALLAEAFGLTNDKFPYVYLSDGGHFENLAVYEMVLRRCKYIVVSDAGADPTFGFDDLGNAIRKIRIDLGIPIEIKGTMRLYPRTAKDPKSPIYCAVADIHYGDVDEGASDGTLLYIKPVFYGKEEPKDVYNYALMNAAFPHQSTGDQWFSESQFESYRTLGEFEMKTVNNGKDSFATVGDLINEARAYVDKNGP